MGVLFAILVFASLLLVLLAVSTIDTTAKIHFLGWASIILVWISTLAVGYYAFIG